MSVHASTRPGMMKPGMSKLSPAAEAKIVAVLRYSDQSDEPMTDSALCGRFDIHTQTLSKIRRKYGLPSTRGVRVL